MANHFVSDKRRDEVAGASAQQATQAQSDASATRNEAEYKNGSAQTAAHQTLHRSTPGAIPSIHSKEAADAAAAEEARLASLQ